MENKDEVLKALEEFDKQSGEHLPKLLEDYFNHVAATGETLFPWSKVQPVFIFRMEQAMQDFFKDVPTDTLPPCPNVRNVKFEELRESIVKAASTFAGAPFTIQRLCELITKPRIHYKRTDKFLRGIEKNIMVVSTVDPFGNKIVSENKNLVNGLDANGIDKDGENMKNSPFRIPPAPPSSAFSSPSSPPPPSRNGDDASASHVTHPPIQMAPLAPEEAFSPITSWPGTPIPSAGDHRPSSMVHEQTDDDAVVAKRLRLSDDADQEAMSESDSTSDLGDNSSDSSSKDIKRDSPIESISDDSNEASTSDSIARAEDIVNRSIEAEENQGESMDTSCSGSRTGASDSLLSVPSSTSETSTSSNVTDTAKLSNVIESSTSEASSKETTDTPSGNERGASCLVPDKDGCNVSSVSSAGDCKQRSPISDVNTEVSSTEHSASSSSDVTDQEAAQNLGSNSPNDSGISTSIDVQNKIEMKSDDGAAPSDGAQSLVDSHNGDSIHDQVYAGSDESSNKTISQSDKFDDQARPTEQTGDATSSSDQSSDSHVTQTSDGGMNDIKRENTKDIPDEASSSESTELPMETN